MLKLIKATLTKSEGRGHNLMRHPGDRNKPKEYGQVALMERPKQFKAGRKCQFCAHRLSIYNPYDVCLSDCTAGEMKRYE